MSISRVEAQNPLEPIPSKPANIKPLVIKFREQIANAKNYGNPNFVDDVATTIKELYETSTGTSSKPSELINNLHAMLNAPISLENGDDMSLYEASQAVPHDALAQILKMHVKLPDSAELFINELNVLANDL